MPGETGAPAQLGGQQVPPPRVNTRSDRFECGGGGRLARVGEIGHGRLDARRPGRREHLGGAPAHVRRGIAERASDRLRGHAIGRHGCEPRERRRAQHRIRIDCELRDPRRVRLARDRERGGLLAGIRAREHPGEVVRGRWRARGGGRAHVRVGIAEQRREIPGRFAWQRFERREPHRRVAIRERAAQRRVLCAARECARACRAHRRDRVREPAHERGRDAALAEARDQLEHRTRRARGLRAQQLVAQVRKADRVPLADVVVEITQVEAPAADPFDERVEIGAPRREIRAEIDQRSRTADRRERAQVGRLQRQQEDRRRGHRAVGDDALEKRADPAAEARR